MDISHGQSAHQIQYYSQVSFCYLRSTHYCYLCWVFTSNGFNIDCSTICRYSQYVRFNHHFSHAFSRLLGFCICFYFYFFHSFRIHFILKFLVLYVQNQHTQKNAQYNLPVPSHTSEAFKSKSTFCLAVCIFHVAESSIWVSLWFSQFIFQLYLPYQIFHVFVSCLLYVFIRNAQLFRNSFSSAFSSHTRPRNEYQRFPRKQKTLCAGQVAWFCCCCCWINFYFVSRTKFSVFFFALSR